jgi:signal transduction histidine kinase
VKAAFARNRVRRFLFDHGVLLLTVLIVVMVVASFSYLRRLQEQLLTALPVEGTRLQLQTLEEVRALYTSEVVEVARKQGIEVTQDYHGKERAIPLPATLMIELGQRLAQSRASLQVRLYSDYPFPWRKDGGPRDAFEREALTALRRNPTEPFFRFQDYNGQRALRYAVADRMLPACVSCHNTHPDSPKHDWKVGDVRGALEATRFITTFAVTAQEDQRRAFWLIGATGMLGFVSVGLAFAKQRRDARALRESAARLMADINVRRRAEGEVRRLNDELERRVVERTQQLEDVHRQLRDASHEAGMAEVATNVLHNVGNVLNSVNVSADLIAQQAQTSEAASLARVVSVLRDHQRDLGAFVTADARGQHLVSHLGNLAEHLQAEQTAIVREIGSLRANIEHIKDIVTMQQRYAKLSGANEIVCVVDLVEDSLRLNAGALVRHRVEVVRDFQDRPVVNLDKHKVLQILVNLVRNAKYACEESQSLERRVTLRVAVEHGGARISVIDNGVGIAPENLTRIFNHGFTTRASGHGFGLHSGALAAKELGGSLNVHSDGPGRGATFTLELPVHSTRPADEPEAAHAYVHWQTRRTGQR